MFLGHYAINCNIFIACNLEGTSKQILENLYIHKENTKAIMSKPFNGLQACSILYPGKICSVMVNY